MDITHEKPLTGRKFALIICSGFAVIIGANLTLAFQAIATFPGLETKNSYVASQSFEADRAAQLALGWDVSARHEKGELRLLIKQDGKPIAPKIRSAVLGRATHVADDQFPELRFDGAGFAAPVVLGAGNWNLRLIAEAPDGKLFRQRVIVDVMQ